MWHAPFFCAINFHTTPWTFVTTSFYGCMDLENLIIAYIVKFAQSFFFLEEMEQWTLMGTAIVFVKKSLFKFKGSHWFQKLMLKGVVKQIANCQSSFYKSISILWPLFLVEDLKTNSSRFQGALLFFNFSSCVRLMHYVHLNVWSLNIVSMCCVCDVFLPCLEVLYQFWGTLGLNPSSLSTLTLILSWHLFMKLSLCL
jgi:hypothetical protein